MKKSGKNLHMSKKCSTFAPSNKNKQQFKSITIMKPFFELVSMVIENKIKNYNDYTVENYYFSKNEKEYVMLVVNLTHKESGENKQIEVAVGYKD